MGRNRSDQEDDYSIEETSIADAIGCCSIISNLSQTSDHSKWKRSRDRTVREVKDYDGNCHDKSVDGRSRNQVLRVILLIITRSTTLWIGIGFGIAIGSGVIKLW